MDVGQGRRVPRGFFKAEEDTIPYPPSRCWKEGTPISRGCVASCQWCLGHRSSWKSSQGKQVVRTSLGQHKAWK